MLCIIKLKRMKYFFSIGLLTLLFSCQNDNSAVTENKPSKEELKKQAELIREKEIRDSLMVFRSCDNYSGVTFDKLRDKYGIPFDEIKNKYNVSPFETVMYYRGEIYTGFVKQCLDGFILNYCEFKDGLANGDYITYDTSTGKLFYTCQFKDGKENGEFKSYDSEGNIESISIYEMGELIKKTVFD